MTVGMGSSNKFKTNRPHGYDVARTQVFTPEQMNLFSQQFSQVSPDSFLSRLASGDQSQFDELEAPAFRQFNELIGDVSSRFSGIGTGARKSSGFQNATSAAASNFAQELQANRLNIQQQAIQDLMNHSNMILNQSPYETSLVEKPQKQPNPWLMMAAKAVSKGVGDYAGGMGGSGGAGGGGFQSSKISN